MIGANRMQLNQATVIEALQYYFEKVLFAEGRAPRIVSVSAVNSGGTNQFDVAINTPDKPAAVLVATASADISPTPRPAA